MEKLQQEMKRYFKCNFIPPKDFLGLDITIPQPGDITLSMHTFTAKMVDALQVHDDYPEDIITPGRTDKKVIRGENVEPNQTYRSKVESLNWLTMGIRFDVVYMTKELSRVLAEPTKTANETVHRALIYIKRTQNAYLRYSHDDMMKYEPPPTRRKPTDINDTYDISYNTTDNIKHEDEVEYIQEYTHPGPTMSVVVKTDCDLVGQTETRQTTTSLMACLGMWSTCPLAGAH